MGLGLVVGGIVFHLIIGPLFTPYLEGKNYVVWYPVIATVTYVIVALPFAIIGEKIIYS